MPSKEAFCLEILNLYHAGALKTIRETLGNESIPPLKRLDDYIDAHARFLKIAGAENGCLYGNVTAELNEHSVCSPPTGRDFFGDSQSGGRVPEGGGEGGRVATEVQMQ
jgi:hypothetical protein